MPFKNPADKIAYEKQRYKQNKQGIRAQQKDYYNKNREQIAAQHKEYRSHNIQLTRACCRHYRMTHKEEARFRKIFSKYGLTKSCYLKLIEEQKNSCKICLISFEGMITKNIHVDHCHNTNKVRGLLCSLCNTSLGGFKDDINILKRAIKYLTRSIKLSE